MILIKQQLSINIFLLKFQINQIKMNQKIKLFLSLLQFQFINNQKAIIEQKSKKLICFLLILKKMFSYAFQVKFINILIQNIKNDQIINFNLTITFLRECKILKINLSFYHQEFQFYQLLLQYHRIFQHEYKAAMFNRSNLDLPFPQKLVFYLYLHLINYEDDDNFLLFQTQNYTKHCKNLFSNKAHKTQMFKHNQQSTLKEFNIPLTLYNLFAYLKQIFQVMLDSHCTQVLKQCTYLINQQYIIA
ncbi:hypothetical protein TTHERM_000107039 (macronuclear) [Tetrahymena thermophila SB210]|uniref:Uncharacterized protein n=1 Tax=Tetrahymena thermophila (strain SB210) TaxID=312017 RepID=W7XD56_TETTS|nr:hypothetical protein TTHERM_000107039 [Tetrahymena thermophila SB210]EWS75427.1 hypothetical protein TTHERM_000107039 [Tetrahymena thermophila SB210]|eukprot:XP_012652101.1 hypothetical protein TTHERM_000107039 [Tetrahymena thermophila SB210]